MDLADEVGAVFAAEARRHGVDVVLAPQVNLQRTPVGGRHFECYSEDPLLTGAIAVHVVKSAQDRGVGMCIKHFVANDSETERTSYLARVDERTLREVYLAPFEQLVLDAQAWSVMGAYSGVDDGAPPRRCSSTARCSPASSRTSGASTASSSATGWPPSP